MLNKASWMQMDSKEGSGSSILWVCLPSGWGFLSVTLFHLYVICLHCILVTSPLCFLIGKPDSFCSPSCIIIGVWVSQRPWKVEFLPWDCWFRCSVNGYKWGRKGGSNSTWDLEGCQRHSQSCFCTERRIHLNTDMESGNSWREDARNLSLSYM